MGSKTAVCEWVLPQRGPAAVRQAAALGFDGIQITELGGYEADFPLLRRETLQAYREAAEETGIRLQALHLWSLCRLASLLHPMESRAGQVAVRSLEKGLEACRALSIPRLMVTSGMMCQVKNEADFNQFITYMRWLCGRAEEAGVTVCFESSFSPEQILAVYEATGRRIRVCYDFFNPVRFHLGDPVEEIRRLAPRGCIDHYHVKDGPEDCIGCSLLGEGIGRYRGQTALLRELGYQGWLVTENYYGDMEKVYRRPWETLARADRDTMRQFFA